jgi:hypothetical protein
MVLLFLILTSCSTSSRFDDSLYPYNINADAIKNKPIKKLIMATVSLGTPTKSYLAKSENRARNMVKDYLNDSGYELLPSYHFDNAWKQALRDHGNPYDASIGKLDIDTWRDVVVTTAKILERTTDADAVIFANIVEVKIQHSSSSQHYARWDGIYRKPGTQGLGSGVPLSFNWSETINGGSLQIAIYNMDLIRVFSSRGGIDTLEAIDMKSSDPSFIRRKKVLKDVGNMEDAVQLAFHPFIVMDDYPSQEK